MKKQYCASCLVENTILVFQVLIIVIISLCFNDVAGQVAINNSGDTANNSAIFDVSSTDKGILVPRMSRAQMEAISDPANGLIIFNTDDDMLYIFNGTDNAWYKLAYGDESLVTQPQLGDYLHGGVVFYLDGNGGGLVCAISDQSTGIQWYNGTYMNTGAIATNIGDGNTNTTTIIGAQGEGSYAASLCAGLSLNGFDNWFLPSKEELHEIYLMQAVIDSTATAHGGDSLASVHYWSSSETGNNSAWSHDFDAGGQFWSLKNLTYRVRAVRTFPDYAVGSGGDCANATVNGEYRPGSALDFTHNVSLDVTVNKPGDWEISTNTLNGYNFSGSGVFFETGTHTVYLKGTGTPVEAQTDYFTVTTGSPGGCTGCGFEVDVLPALGDFYGGGMVFWLDGNEGGLIGSIHNLGTEITWDNGTHLFTWASDNGISNGQGNTNKIVNTHGSGSYAAKLCDDLVEYGYDNWFLPSRDELTELFNTSTYNLNQVSLAHGGDSVLSDRYWSSTEHSETTAKQVLPPSSVSYAEKGVVNAVRPVRSFPDRYRIGSYGYCNNTTVHGTYLEGIALDSSHYVQIQVEVRKTGPWFVSTPWIHGYAFIGSGTFTSTGFQDIILYGDGEPWLAEQTSFRAKADIAGGFTKCQFDVTVGALAIGDFYAGGIIFYLDGSGGGMVCDINDVSSSVAWATGSNMVTGATGTAIGTGATNTGTIVSVLGAGTYAAILCDNLSVNGYDDWFLPSKEELHQMFVNKAAIDATAIAQGGAAFAATYYWSSSEVSTSSAWAHDFEVDGQYWTDKNLPYPARAVREF